MRGKSIDIEILTTTKNGDRAALKPIRITIRPPIRNKEVVSGRETRIT